MVGDASAVGEGRLGFGNFCSVWWAVGMCLSQILSCEHVLLTSLKVLKPYFEVGLVRQPLLSSLEIVSAISTCGIECCFAFL